MRSQVLVALLVLGCGSKESKDAPKEDPKGDPKPDAKPEGKRATLSTDGSRVIFTTTF